MSPSPGTARQPATLCAVAAVIAAATALALHQSWLRWPDPTIDFGKELYLAWRLCEGEVLYRDVAHFLGPLSPYLNAAWFCLFGEGAHTLFAVNVVLMSFTMVLLYVLLLRVGSHFACTGAMLVFVAVFSTTQLIHVGNYNHVAPNTHENTHGLLLALLAMWCLVRDLETRRPAMALAAGVALGLAALTRPAPVLACGLAMSLGLGLRAWQLGPGALGWLATRVTLLAAGAVLVVLLAWLTLSSAMPAADALRGTLSPWLFAADSSTREQPFYRWGMGIDDVAGNLRAMLRHALTVLGVGGGLALTAGLAGRPSRRGALLAVSAFLLVFALARLSLNSPEQLAPWLEWARALPVLTGLALLAVLVPAVRARDREPTGLRPVVAVMLCGFALGMLAKMALFARLHHYGYVLAMPAVLLLVVVALHWIPCAVRRAGGDGRVFTAGAAALVVVFVLAVRYLSGVWIDARTHVVGEGGDRFLAGPRGAVVQAVVDDIEQLSPPEATLAVMPGGVMLNYLTRRRNPTRYHMLTAVELYYFGESAVLAAYQESPPDLIVRVHTDEREFGRTGIGVDYGQRLDSWLEDGYAMVHGYRTTAGNGAEFGLSIHRRRPRSRHDH